MSKRYEHRVDSLKEHKQEKGHKHHHTKKKSNIRNRKTNKQKKAY